jgi:hypothetical protein
MINPATKRSTNMRKFSTGFMLGIAFGAALPAVAASLIGGTGYLSDWTANHEIECD